MRNRKRVRAVSEIIFAVPKGRILLELLPLMKKVGVEPEEDFHNVNSRRLSFSTNLPYLTLIRVRSFDVATFVAFGGAHLGVTGFDTLLEFEYPNVYAPVDLGIGRCRMSLAEPKEKSGHSNNTWDYLRVATKYPNATKNYFNARGMTAECIKLSGAIELAPLFGMCNRIVDLVDSGRTLAENGLEEKETIAEISSRLIVNQAAWKTRTLELDKLIENFSGAVNAETA